MVQQGPVLDSNILTFEKKNKIGISTIIMFAVVNEHLTCT